MFKISGIIGVSLFLYFLLLSINYDPNEQNNYVVQKEKYNKNKLVYTKDLYKVFGKLSKEEQGKIWNDLSKEDQEKLSKDIWNSIKGKK